MWGDTILIGAYQDDNSGEDSGSAYIFQKNDEGTWFEAQQLLPPGREFRSWFGYAVSIFEDTAVVAAGGEGMLYVFERDRADSWNLTEELRPTDWESQDLFGRSVSMATDLIVAGAYKDERDGVSSGAAYVFERGADGAWAETQKLVDPNAAAKFDFGISVAVSHATIFVGSSKSGVPTHSGTVLVFDRQDDGGWEMTQELLPSVPRADNDFGELVAASGDLLVVGSFGEEDLAGAAYIFERDSGGEWREAQRIIADDADTESLSNVAVFGETVVLGSALDSEAAFVFEPDAEGVWIREQTLTASDGESGDRFTSALAIHGSTLVGGSWLDDDNGSSSGSAYVFSLEACDLQIALKPETPSPGDLMTVSVTVKHGRREPAVVPLHLWIEAETGEVILQATTRELHFEYADTVTHEVIFVLPTDLDPGSYEVLLAVAEMRQGDASVSHTFKVR